MKRVNFLNLKLSSDRPVIVANRFLKLPHLLSFASDKAKLFPKNFSKNFNLDDSDIFLPVFLLRTNLKLPNISVTPKTVKIVIKSFD